MTASLTATGLDGRVTDEDGRPVPRVRLVRGWFTIQRAREADQVELTTRIPGYLDKVTRHADQAAAEHSAKETYAAYCSDCRPAAAGEQPER